MRTRDRADAAEVPGYIPRVEDGSLVGPAAQEGGQRRGLADPARAHGRGLRGPPAPPQPGPYADETARRVHHETDERQAEPEQPVRRPDREELAEQDVEQRPQSGAEELV